MLGSGVPDEPQLDDGEKDNIAQEWETIHSVIIKIEDMVERRSQEPSDKEFEAADTAFKNIRTKSPTANIHKLHHSCFQKYLKTKVLPSLREKDDQSLLQEYARRWKNHQILTTQHRRLLWPVMMSSLSLSNSFCYSVGEYLQDCFLESVHSQIDTKVIEAVNKLVNRGRDGENIDWVLLKTVVGMFFQLAYLSKPYYDLETRMIEEAYCYYSKKASKWITEDSCAVYLLKFEQCLRKEPDWATHGLIQSSAEKLIMRVKEAFLEHAYQLIPAGKSSLELLKVEDISRMYRVFSGFKGPLPIGLEEIASIFKQHLTNECICLIQQAEESKSTEDFMGQVSELLDKYLACVGRGSSHNSLLRKALRESFEELCSKKVASRSIAECLATYFDNILKEGLGDDATLDKGVKLLAYIKDTNLFAEFYRRKLSRRLLFGKCANDDRESLMVIKLREQVGNQFTKNMEKMLTDMKLVKDNENEFHDYLRRSSDASPSFDFKVTALTNKYWPGFEHSANLKLPIEMARCVSAYEEFFRTKKRRLTWIYSLGSCLISGTFDEKPIELVVSTYQGAALLLFNPQSRLSYADIKEQLDLDDSDLERILASLSGPKCKILNKDPNTASISQTDIFEFNSKFTDKRSRIKVPLPSLPLDKKRKRIVEAVGIDRSYAIQALLVRIMKTRKVLAHEALVKECIERSDSCKPDIKDIKKGIESLIDREYMKRDENNWKLYRYLPD